MGAQRRRLLAASWKMHFVHAQALEYLRAFTERVRGLRTTEIVLLQLDNFGELCYSFNLTRVGVCFPLTWWCPMFRIFILSHRTRLER